MVSADLKDKKLSQIQSELSIKIMMLEEQRTLFKIIADKNTELKVQISQKKEVCVATYILQVTVY